MWSIERNESYQQIVSQPIDVFQENWERWHQGREERLATEHGWLSLRSIDWLDDGETKRIPGFPGTWRQDGSTVTYTPDPETKVTNKGRVLDSPFEVTVEKTGDYNLEDFDDGDVRAQLIKRIGSDRQYAVRVRDPHSAARSEFAGVPHFAPDPRWVVPARYVPNTQWESVIVNAVDGGLSHDETGIGTLYVSIAGAEYPLTVFQGHNDTSGLIGTSADGRAEYLDHRVDRGNIGFLLFKDGTSGKETYGGARVLTFDISNPAAVTFADFNRAMNLPCAFTAYCTCPFAPLSNRLPIRVTAGEKVPEHSY